MVEPEVILDSEMRKVVEAAIREVCAYKKWRLHEVSVRSNHVHVVATASDTSPNQVMGTFKAYGSRAMNTMKGHREHWWTRDGSKRRILNEESLHKAIAYVHGQDYHRTNA